MSFVPYITRRPKTRELPLDADIVDFRIGKEEQLCLKLRWPVAHSWSSNLLTLSEESDEDLLRLTGSALAEIDDARDLITVAVKTYEDNLRICLPVRWEGIARYGFKASFELVHDMQVAALAGSSKQERLADEAELLAALERALGEPQS